MYLSDTDIRLRLAELKIECHDPNYPFSADDQIQPCSIDLRLSNVFWEPLRGATIDLRKSALLELEPRRYYRRVVLRPDEFITLKPGKMLIASTYEKFSVPANCATKLEGRSSFGRLGISVHCTGDFANPGYRGNFPLVLTNHSPTPIRFFPFIPICQLMLVPLSGTPARQYGEQVLQSKYMDDDGGPSYWWRDKRIRTLQQALATGHIDVALQDELLNRIGIQEPEVIERFDRFLARSHLRELGNSQQVLLAFAESEDRLRTRNRFIKGAWIVLLTITASVGGSLITSKPYGTWHYVIWAVTIFCVIPCIRAFTIPETTYYGVREHDRHRREND